MRTPSLRSMVPMFMVAALLAAPPARAADWLSSPFERIWTRLSALWAEGGCVIDPSGGCREQAGSPTGITADTGCVIDPSGGCREGAQAPPSDLDRPRRP
jgi:hypothetical protein